MAELLIVCLGDFQVTLAGTALTDFPTDKTRALLAYLTIEGRVHQRSDLAHFLWPGYSEESARNSLRQSLHQLRQLLHDAEAGGPLGAPCLARLGQAVDLSQGDFLAGFSVADSDPFEEWRRITQEQLHIQMLDALSQLADAAERAGDEEGALRTAQRQLALEPRLEAAHRRVMRILAQRGQRTAALLQQGYNLLQQDAAALDEASRHHFFTGVSIHRDLVAAYAGCRHRQRRSQEKLLVSWLPRSLAPCWLGAAVVNLFVYGMWRVAR